MMLVANAGSGKTHALTTRMITLLALGVDPRKIVALTFTKKAAGEFLDAVFVRLARAALNEKALAELRVQTKIADLDAGGCTRLLCRLCLSAGVLSMGTIDSLFVSIARAFPLESGLSGNFTMIRESDLEMARTEAIASIFREEAASADAGAFLDLVRRIVRRKGERDVFGNLLTAVANFHATYLLTPASVEWGDARSIWPAGSVSPMLSCGEAAPAAAYLLQVIKSEHPSLSEKAEESWRRSLNAAAEHKPGSSWSKELKKFVKEKLCNQPTIDSNGEEYLPTGKAFDARVYLRGEIPAARIALRDALLKPEFESLLRRSAALYRFMECFEKCYDETTRKSGRMTFSDITDMLSKQVCEESWIATAGYRLDSSFDHWLLDEFQDTSRLQWSVLKGFIDEVIQDPSGNRSFFYVGDTKQAIYSWRGGDPGLFFQIRDYYNQWGEQKIQEDQLPLSYRSAPPIVSFINAVFGDIQSVSPELEYPSETVYNWQRAWRKHEVAPENAKLNGCVRWLPVEQVDDDERAEDLAILSILMETRPWERGWSCAVLKTKNDHAADIASLLQSHGIPVAVEGRSNPCTDNLLGVALLAAFRLAASPEDSISRMLLNASPLSVVLNPGDEIFRREALVAIASAGYEGAVRAWVAQVILPPFLESRVADFLSAASEFDRGLGGSIAEFTAFIEGHSIQEPESTGVVRVMTIHQSKGLTFDMSVVSGLDGRGAQSVDRIHLGGGDPPKWGCLMPSRDLAEADREMSTASSSLKAVDEYGKLCTAYVALTRSRRALYVVTKKLGPGTTSKNFARLLTETLHPGGDFYEIGESNWYEDKPRRPVPVDEELAKEIPLPTCTTGTPHPLSPSSLAEPKMSDDPGIRGDFEGGTSLEEAADLGIEIHEILSLIQWDCGAVDLSRCSVEARRLLGKFLEAVDARGIFTQPEGDWILWRERAFDIMIGRDWVSGVFDRVHIRMENGKPVEIMIFDYKTNHATPSQIEKKYAGQMDLYRRAASKLLGLDLRSISARTVPIRT